MTALRLFSITVTIIVLTPTVSIANNDIPYHYNVHIPDDMSQFNVEICFTSTSPSSTKFTLDKSNKHFTNIRRVISTTTYPASIKQLRSGLSHFNRGDCIAYTAPFDGNITYPRYKGRQSIKEQILVTFSQWMWRPAKQETKPITINYYLPEHLEVSAPGHLLSTSPGKRTYLLQPRPQDWEGRIAIGQFKSITRFKNDARINIAILNDISTNNQNKLIQWIDANLSALYQVYNELPVNDLQLLVVPVGRDKEPVPWGQVMRGGGDAVHLYIDETRPLQEFMDDWVLIHELSHLLHPLLTVDSKWLSEGLASYYQNVLRARSGLLTEKQAWEKMIAGFNRGIRGTSSEHSLTQDSETMMRNRSFMRVYWSGAAISLTADTLLRNKSRNKQS